MDQSLLLPTEFFPEPRKKTPGTEPEPAPRRVVIAYDQTRYNDALLDRVIRTGLLDPDDRIHLVHVVSQNDIKTFLNRIAGATSGVEANLYASIQGATDLHANALASAAEDLLLAVAKVLRDHSFHYVKTEVVHGDPKQTIMDYCHCVHPDFLMTGSKGSNIVKRAVLGSTSDYLARNCPCPVMIVKVTQDDIERRKELSETKLNAFESLIRKSSARSYATPRPPSHAHSHHTHGNSKNTHHVGHNRRG